ncbi:hypothetical protein PVNG_02198 [Plasmodium vivax North Korean]|uniref:Uncharacterized protein n=1 Tax=Plasmodium vivax North Korean TaxID=1035514 RepID=A0A0J9TTS3_PLAVI|nr:hypothetical protein PVNG_02198 [Plasmodium vivax North Korean]
MLNNKLDILKWKEVVRFYYLFLEKTYFFIKINIYVFCLNYQYRFLDKVWNTYYQFDNSVDDDPDKYKYEGFCDPLMKRLGDDDVENKKFCLKLVRNLGRYSHNFKFQQFTSEYCTNLNNWVYDSIKKYKNPHNIIDKCYEDYTEFVREIGNRTICPYYKYDDMYKEPINIIILKIFESNMNIIQNALEEEYDSNNIPLRNYICECINIYKEMDKTYCRNNNDEDEKGKLTCSALNTFRDTYKFFLFSPQNRNYNIPSLDDVETEYKKKCVEENLELPSSAPTYSDVPELQPSTGYMDGRKGEFSSASPLTGENPGSSMTRTVSTAVGTMAGASSLLALLYKVTQKFI